MSRGRGPTPRRLGAVWACLLLLFGLGAAYAQMPQMGSGMPGPKAPGPKPGSQTVVPQTAAPRASKTASPAEILIFRIRSAFSLSPPMVASLQAKGSDEAAAPAAPAATSQGATAPSASQAASSAGAGSAQRAESAQGDRAYAIAWSDALVREVPYSVPLDVRLVGKNVLALVQLVPIETGSQEITLLVQGQVWVQKPDGTLSFKSSFQSLNLALGSRIYFYPLGLDGKNGAPIAVEIRVDGPAP